MTLRAARTATPEKVNSMIDSPTVRTTGPPMPAWHYNPHGTPHRMALQAAWNGTPGQMALQAA